MRKSGKYNKKIAAKIIELIKADTYTVNEVCRMAHITKTTFYNWQDKYSDFADGVAAAREELKEILLIEARKGLRKKINGYDITETKVVAIPDKDGNPKVKEQITYKKHIPADTAAIIFTLTNGDPETWKNNRGTIEVTGKDGKDLFAQKNDEELTAEIVRLSRILEIGNPNVEDEKGGSSV